MPRAQISPLLAEIKSFLENLGSVYRNQETTVSTKEITISFLPLILRTYYCQKRHDHVPMIILTTTMMIHSL